MPLYLVDKPRVNSRLFFKNLTGSPEKITLYDIMLESTV